MFKDLLEQQVHLPEKNALIKTTYLNQISHEQTRELLKKAYSHTSVNLKLMATVFNAIVTEKKSTFWLSRSIFESLLAQDKNASREKLSGTTYKDFIDYAVANNLLEQRREGGIIQGKKVPSVFRLVDAHLLSMFDACCVHDWRKSIDEHACERWDNLYKSTSCDKGRPSKSPEKEKEKKREKKPNKPAFQEEIQELIASHPEYSQMLAALPLEERDLLMAQTDLDTFTSLLKRKVDQHLTPKLALPEDEEDLFPGITESAPNADFQDTPVPTPKENRPSLEAIIRQWRKQYDNLSFLKAKERESNIGELIATIKGYGYAEGDISKSAILRACFGTNPSPKLKSWRDEVSATIEDCILDTYQAPVQIAQSAPAAVPVRFNTPEAKVQYDKLVARGVTPADLNGVSLAEYANQRAYADSFPVMNTSELEERMRKFMEIQDLDAL
jgi:hypothetical protein